MNERFSNIYEDSSRADAYSQLEFPGTYFLAYRDLPAIINAHVSGRQALDFGCGTGRSTRFLGGLGFKAVGVDISEQMIRKARERDPVCEYLTVGEGNLQQLHGRQFDLAFCAFTFDNIPGDKKARCFQALNGVLKQSGFIVNLVPLPRFTLTNGRRFQQSTSRRTKMQLTVKPCASSCSMLMTDAPSRTFSGRTKRILNSMISRT